MNILRYVGQWFVGLLREVGSTHPVAVPEVPENPEITKIKGDIEKVKALHPLMETISIDPSLHATKPLVLPLPDKELN